ncbi:ATP-dependent sacrificial sulfur transferase LarE [Pseudactinotalea sp. HY160]|uniref:ATP-dependent sacrificial sulfur transferase LarE n=1 Tax=Pseudactinotalea sp. HY160 TaxID=2654490 RepID=UPI00128B331C|nr:ATP-dependent sacrificial sulfur transferase LarE [Pseudactinotalea sp. HY160]MPV50021.1 ATP-dependent sacrificial sulfur transferase LarE [Pseudactinotalea sp. HY160]
MTPRTEPTPEALTGALARARAELRGHAPLGVAYSGGVDSATLLALAVAELGADQVVAILGVSPSLATDERERAHATAREIGARVVEIRTHEGENESYRANGPDRCFHCKDELFTRISDELVDELGLAAIAYGENADDARRPDRPGAQAAVDHRVLRPMSAAGMTKLMVRQAARQLGVPVADKPAAPCLASRIPHFQEVTPEKLRQIDEAEGGLRRLGFTDCRVRHHGEIARIEVPIAEIPAAARQHEAIHALVTAAGFTFAALDLRGIQSGAFTLPLVLGATRA